MTLIHSHLSSWEQWIWVGHAAASVKVWITCWEHLPGTCPWAGNQQSRGFFFFLTNLSLCKQKIIGPRRAWMCLPSEVHWARRWKSVLWQLLPRIFFLFPSLLPIYVVQLLGLSRKRAGRVRQQRPEGRTHPGTVPAEQLYCQSSAPAFLSAKMCQGRDKQISPSLIMLGESS